MYESFCDICCLCKISIRRLILYFKLIVMVKVDLSFLSELDSSEILQKDDGVLSEIWSWLSIASPAYGTNNTKNLI